MVYIVIQIFFQFQSIFLICTHGQEHEYPTKILLLRILHFNRTNIEKRQEKELNISKSFRLNDPEQR